MTTLEVLRVALATAKRRLARATWYGDRAGQLIAEGAVEAAEARLHRAERAAA